MILTIGSSEFLSELERAPKQDFLKKSDCLVVPHELVFNIPDWAAYKAIEWMDNVFMPYFDQAFKIANANAGVFSKVQKLFDEGEWISRMQIADITRKHGRSLDEFIAEFDLEATSQKNGAKGHPITYYRQVI